MTTPWDRRRWAERGAWTLARPPADGDRVTAVGEDHRLATDLVPGPVDYRLLRPAGYEGDAIPLLLLLHGGGGSAAQLDLFRPVVEQLWSDGSLPPMVVAMPSAGRSFYLDRANGTQRWQRFLVDDLLPHLLETTGAGGGGADVVIGGISMGGMGALRTAFSEPERFVAVAAVEPGIEESAVWAEVLLRDRVYRDDAVMAELYGDPFDEAHYHDHHPRTVALRNGHRIAASGLAIAIECGDEDLLHLQYGTEALHRQLFAQGIDHEYRLVRGADHLGPSLMPRVGDALRFLGRTLAAREVPPPTDALLGAFTVAIRAQELDRGYRRTSVVAGPAGPIEVHEMGEGHPVVLLPSLGRGAADFDVIARRLARAGHHVVAPEPRGLGGSAGPLDDLTLDDLADDVAAVITDRVGGPATVVGHAFGNRVARSVAARHPALVESVVLLACGGRVPPAPAVAAALRAVFDPGLDDEAHLEAVRTAFFAPGNDPAVWRDGWDAPVAAAQVAATERTPVDRWWTAGAADVLVVQPAEDVVAVAANADAIVEALGERATLITVPGAGHALLPEQPAAVAVALLTWLHRRRGGAAPAGDQRG